MKTPHLPIGNAASLTANVVPGRLHVWIEAHDRHRTWTGLALVGVPLTILVAVLGQPPFGFHPLHYFGVMGPTCGMTRGVMWFARGNFARAWAFNPGSLLILPSMALLLARSAYGRFTGRWLSVSFKKRRWLVGVAVLAVVLLSVRQQLNADFLLQNPAG